MAIKNIIGDIATFLSTYSVVIGKSFMGFFGGIGALLELHNLYSVSSDDQVAQRKTKIGTYFVGLSLNLFYTIASLTGKVVSYLTLGFIGIAAELVALARASYILHQSRKIVDITEKRLAHLQKNYDPLMLGARETAIEIKQLEDHLFDQHDFYFRSKVVIAYTLNAVLAAGLFIAGLFATPLMVASFTIFTVGKIVQAYDTYHDYKLSRGFSKALGYSTGSAATATDVPANTIAQSGLNPALSYKLAPNTATIMVKGNFANVATAKHAVPAYADHVEHDTYRSSSSIDQERKYHPESDSDSEEKKQEVIQALTMPTHETPTMSM